MPWRNGFAPTGTLPAPGCFVQAATPSPTSAVWAAPALRNSRLFTGKMASLLSGDRPPKRHEYAEDATENPPARVEVMISPEDFVERLCLIGADRGPRRFPRKQRDREILIKSFVMSMNSAYTYTEREINELLLEWSREVAPAIYSDHVTIRRILVDHGHLERTADGARYRVGFPPRPLAFDLEIDDIDPRSTVAAFRDYSERKKRTRSADRATSHRHESTANGDP